MCGEGAWMGEGKEGGGGGMKGKGSGPASDK